MRKESIQGKVWLVGAGPGDPGLLTLKAKQVLTRAEVVVYDALIGREILQMIPADAEGIYVGKRSGRHTMRQEEINCLLVEKARAGKRVVRLKGGDPFLFGRGGEEAEALAEGGIPFEIVPGISSAIAVPAYQGIPVTHRDFASSVHIITGRTRADVRDTMDWDASARVKGACRSRKGAGSRIDYDALVRAGGTLVFLMGVAALGEICRGLLAAGMEPEMPAALLMRGTTAKQERVMATVGTLEQTVAKTGAQTPAVIVVGKVCALAEKFSWADTLPLHEMRVFLTRPKELSGETADRLRALGAEVAECPSIRIMKREHSAALAEALDQIGTYQWLVFTSPTGVRIFFEELHESRFDVRKLGSVKIACIGSGSARELEKHGIYPDLVPDVFDGAHLGAALFCASSPGDRILILRAASGNPELVEALAGRTAEDVPLYDTVYETKLFADWQEEVSFGRNDFVFFTSASTVHGFVAALRAGRGGDMNLQGQLTHDAECHGRKKSCCNHQLPKEDIPLQNFPEIKAICIGERTAQAAKSYGMQTWTAGQASVDGMLACLLEHVLS